MADAIEGRVRELIDAKNFVHVATVRDDGSPHVVPVWGDTDGQYVLLNTDPSRDWPKQAQPDDKVTLNVMNLDNPYEYVEIQGRVDEVVESDADEHLDKLAKKYLDLDEYPFSEEGQERVIVKIEPERIRHNNPRS